MPDQIPEGCVPFRTNLDAQTAKLQNLQQQLIGADPSDIPRLRNLVGAQQRIVIAATAALNNCVANPPVVPVPPVVPIPTPQPVPGVPDPCLGLYNNLNTLIFRWQQAVSAFNDADPDDKLRTKNAMGQAERAMRDAKVLYDNCVTPPVPDAAKPNPAVSKDGSLRPVQKIISWNYLQAKMDEFFNNRVEAPIFTIYLHHEPLDPPPSYATISMIEAVVVNGEVTTDYSQLAFFDLGVLDAGYYFDDIKSDKISVSINPLTPEPLTIKIDFECAGPVEMPAPGIAPDMDFKEFYITLKLSFDLVRFPKPIPQQCNSIQADIDTMKLDLADLQREIQNPNTNHATLSAQINILSKQVAQKQLELATCLNTYGGADPTGTGRLEFLSWVDKIKDLQDDAFDEALKHYVVVHIETKSVFDLGGTTQKTMRGKIFDKLKDPAIHAKINDLASRWMLGCDGTYDVTSMVNDGQNLTMNYLVPAYKLDPFPETSLRPSGWPYLNNPNPDPAFDFSIPSNLSNIKHVVVLTMENRSFDHMFGYLSLPVSAGGMGRTDVDGLKGTEANTYRGTTYPVFPHAIGDTAFTPDPGHSYKPVKQQIGADPNDAGSGKMDGFITAFAGEYSAFDNPNPQSIMGYQPQANVPVFDALARDFGISHRWFASHPGPTFTNRYYELTGRLNLGSGLNKDIPPVPADWWELSNSSPLTPVFTKNIFDYLTTYHQNIESGVTWKYYEHHYSFIRFFSNYTFDSTNVVSIDDPAKGFFADAKNGTLPSVSYIDPHFIELPPNANCDGPVADIKEGQALVQKVVEAVVTSPQFNNTLLIITYDEHGGFFDHVPPPAAVQNSVDSPVGTYGVRVPAIFVSPWVQAGSVFGHDADANGKTLYFDHTSILKTIARRFMSKNPPYMSPRYAAANDLIPVLSQILRKPQFLPFIRYNLKFNASNFMINVPGNAAGAFLTQSAANGSPAQDFSFEVGPSDWTYIRTHVGGLYLTVDAATGSVKQDIKYPTENIKCQLWSLRLPAGTIAPKNSFVLANDLLPSKVLQPQSNSAGAQLVMVDKPTIVNAGNTWTVTSPLIR